MAEGFAAVPTWMIREKRVPRNAILVYASLSSRAGLREIYPSQATIAEEAGLSERTVRTMLKELEALGVVSRERRTSGGSRRATDGYRLHPTGLPANSAGSSDLPATESRSTGNDQQSIPLIEVDRDEVDNCASAHAHNAHSFDEWWQVYPLKKDKGRARTAYKSALKKTTHQVLVDAASAYRDDPNRDPGFTKYPASWLNAEAWENGPLTQRSTFQQGATAVERMLHGMRNHLQGGEAHAIEQ
ncbi:helix-turn-helix domain-containing protein [Leucobacter sp. GX24907]